MRLRRTPFVGSDYQVLSGHVEAAPPRPSVLAPSAGIPAALEEVTLRALTKKPVERYRSAEDFDTALIEALMQAGVDVGQSPSFAGCCEAQASLAAWTCLDYSRARSEAEGTARLKLRQLKPALGGLGGLFCDGGGGTEVMIVEPVG